jgi:hypothetical protein
MGICCRFLHLFIFCVFLSSSHLGAQEEGSNEKKESSDSKDSKEGTDESKPSGESTEDSKKSSDNKEPDSPKEPEPPKIGNFALPASQQPAALFGFGGNIIDKDEIQFYFFGDDFIGKNKITVDLIPSILFGVTKDFSFFFNFPFTPEIKDGGHKSRGLEDFFIQLEYAFYNKSTLTYTDQATILTNITVPTGSIKKNPPTGFGSPSFFLGGTYYRTWVDWIVFVAPGAVLTTSDHGNKFGDQFLYQFGFGRNIPSPEGWIFAWMIEVDGQYNKKNRIHGAIDPNSGGNTIYVTPSLWISSKEIILQFGVSLPVNQNLFGHQRKFDYSYIFNFAWSFY